MIIEASRFFHAFPTFSIYFYFFNLILAVLGLCCCSPAFSRCREWWLLLVEVLRLLVMVASFVAEHGPWRAWASVVAA